MDYEEPTAESGTDIEPIFWDLETTGLNPMDDRIVCVGIGHFEGDERSVEVIQGSSEYHMFQRVRDHCSDIIKNIELADDPTGMRTVEEEGGEAFIVSCYGRGFDHPFYAARCTGIYRQSPFPFGYRKKRLDISRVDGFSGSQDDMLLARGIDVGPDDEITGRDVPNLYDDGQIDTIVNHCESDIHELMALYEYEEEKMLEEVRDHYDL